LTLKKAYEPPPWICILLEISYQPSVVSGSLLKISYKSCHGLLGPRLIFGLYKIVVILANTEMGTRQVLSQVFLEHFQPFLVCDPAKNFLASKF
jgi:hypothetical protein